MNHLITDISNFTRIKAEVELEKNEFININDFMKEVSNYFSDNSKKIKIIVEEVNKNFVILANKSKLLQVFINIIDNSISIANKNTKILLQINSHDQNQVQVKIYDQGKGISLDDHERIFNRF